MTQYNYTIPEAIPTSIFRAYDIRGQVDETLNKDVIYAIARAIGSEAQAQEETTVIVARDGRLSSPLLHKALCQGLLDSGCHVVDIGMVPTPVLYFATHYLPFSSGVMLTGSHNPAHYNGLKMVLKGNTLSEHAVSALRTRIVKRQLTQGQGKLSKKTLHTAYLKRICDDVKLKRKLKIVIDCGNGVAGVIAPVLFERLGCEVITLYGEVDGNFPHHHPDPTQTDNLKDLIAVVKQEKADIGLAFDGDGDRLGVVTEQGNVIWPDRQLMLLSRDVLERHPGGTIVFDVKCSKYLAAIIQQCGGKPLLWKTGHSLIKHKMQAVQALLAGEMSGHIFFKERWYGFDDGLYSGARLLEILAASPQSVSALFNRLPNGINTPEIQLSVPEEKKFDIIDQIIAQANFPDAQYNTIDGLRIEYPDGWGLVRASNTTACLTLRFEADSAEALSRIQSQFQALLKQVGLHYEPVVYS